MNQTNFGIFHPTFCSLTGASWIARMFHRNCSKRQMFWRHGHSILRLELVKTKSDARLKHRTSRFFLGTILRSYNVKTEIPNFNYYDSTNDKTALQYQFQSFALIGWKISSDHGNTKSREQSIPQFFEFGS